MDEGEIEAQRLHDERMEKHRDARRYRWLRVRGCAIDGTDAQRDGLVRRCVNLDEEVDALMASASTTGHKR
jgi:hypothetical protein